MTHGTITRKSMLFHNFTQVADIPNALSEGFMKKDVLFFDKLLDNDNVWNQKTIDKV